MMVFLWFRKNEQLLLMNMFSTGELDCVLYLIKGLSDSFKFCGYFSTFCDKASDTFVYLYYFSLFPFLVMGMLFLIKNLKEPTNFQESTFSKTLFRLRFFGVAGCLSVPNIRAGPDAIAIGIMGWLTKILKGSSHKCSECSGGQYHGIYEGDTTMETARASVDELSDFDKEEIDRAIALSIAEEDEKGKKRIPLEEDEQLAKALQESLNMESPPRQTPPRSPGHDYGRFFPRFPFFSPSGYRTCAGCNSEIGHGRYLSCMGAVWHPECFRCHACDQPISEHEFSTSENRPYHKSCYKDLHHPKCDVCKNFPVDCRYLNLEDGRKLCLECLDSSIMDTHECQPLYLEIQNFYEGLNMKVEQQIPLLLVERQALNEAMEGEKNVKFIKIRCSFAEFKTKTSRTSVIFFLCCQGHRHMPETRGLCLSEEQIVRTISRRPKIGGYRIIDMFTEPYRLVRKCEVTAILVLYGLPRLLTGSILAHEMMHAWLRLRGYPTLSPNVEEGICQVLAHMWLDSEIIAASSSNIASTSSSSSSSASASSSSSSTPPSSKKGNRSEFEKKLGEFFMHQIEADRSAAYGDGFREGNQAVLKYGLKRTLDHILLTGCFP
ncbi:UNVERIFIED_CONTAM: protein DA1-related 1 [Sesamum calycinum]|uniref:Protein DA1-related 1 n=1 Tax=Sesamum calycinum TaxID=2727403 RepID=A0AAW2SW25_9LAMI